MKLSFLLKIASGNQNEKINFINKSRFACLQSDFFYIQLLTGTSSAVRVDFYFDTKQPCQQLDEL